MRKVLSVLLAVFVLGVFVSNADARWRSRRAYYSSSPTYYSPGYYYSDSYYSPGVTYSSPGVGFYAGPRTSYYSTPYRSYYPGSYYSPYYNSYPQSGIYFGGSRGGIRIGW